MDPDERSRALPEVDDVLKRHGHSGGVGVPGRSEAATARADRPGPLDGRVRRVRATRHEAALR